MIQVAKLDDTTFQVTVDKQRKTTHRVTVKPADYQRLTAGKVPPEKLVERSFEFLLEREPNTSILGEFDITVISRYFPEYEQQITGRLSG